MILMVALQVVLSVYNSALLTNEGACFRATRARIRLYAAKGEVKTAGASKSEDVRV